MDVIEGRNGVLSVDLSQNDDYIKLDASSKVTYSICNSEGVAYDGYESLNYDVNPNNLSSINIILPKEINVISDDDLFTHNNVEIQYEYEGNLYTLNESYRVIKFPLYSCKKQDVRNVLGVSESILSDSAIDLYNAYVSMKSDYESFDVDSLLRDKKGSNSIKANRCIVLKAALYFEHALHLLTPKIESDSIVNQTRFTLTGEDFEKVFDNIKDELQGLIDEISGLDEGSYSIGFIVTSNEDVFTGES